jgi:hypothetical protein
VRFFFGLVLGVVIGIGGSIYFFSTGGGDYVVASSPRVLRLEEDLRRVVAEREQVVGKLEEATLLIEQMAAKFTDLERRFQSLESATSHPAQEGVQPEKHDESTEGRDHTKESEADHTHQPQPQESPEAEQLDPTDGHGQETAPTESAVDQQGETTESTGDEGVPPKTPEGEQSGSAEGPS